MNERTIFTLVVLAVAGCGAPTEIYRADSMSQRALASSREVIEACTAFGDSERDYWDDVLQRLADDLKPSALDERIDVFSAIAVGCTLDASYGLAYQRLIWNDRDALRDHLSKLLGTDKDPPLTTDQRRRIAYAVEITELSTPPD